MSKRIQRLLEFAYQKTFDSEHRFPMAAILVKKNKVISVGMNRHKTHPKQKRRISEDGIVFGKNKIHAELDCLIRSPVEVDGSMMVVVRRNATGVGLAKPCVNCEELLREYGVKRVIFSIPKDLESYGVMEL